MKHIAVAGLGLNYAAPTVLLETRLSREESEELRAVLRPSRSV